MNPSPATNPDRQEPARGAPPLRLIVIPFLLVLGLVLLWLQLRLPTHLGRDPRSLVDSLRQVNRESWRHAYALASLLRNSTDDTLRRDEALCRDLTAVLEDQLASASGDPDQVRLRVLLCRTLGEFELADGLPVLVRAASARPRAAPEVRCAALEALAVLTSRIGPERVRGDQQAMQVLIAASRTQAAASEDRAAAELRSTAAYALGVVGGEPASDELARRCQDAHPDTRFNAATGLARWGDPRAVPVLREMLDATNADAVRGEPNRPAQQRKRTAVLVNGLRASRLLAQHQRSVVIDQLAPAIRVLTNSADVSPAVRTAARETLLELGAN